MELEKKNLYFFFAKYALLVVQISINIIKSSRGIYCP